jgi:hypothetical protein
LVALPLGSGLPSFLVTVAAVVGRHGIIQSSDITAAPKEENAMKLSSIVPWGRSFAEYRDMFALSEGDLQGRVLGCGDGPASFNAEATVAGIRVVSIDPLYAYTAPEIERRVSEIFETVVSQTRAQAHRFVWDRFSDADSLGLARLNAMQRFLLDYKMGKKAGRYVAASLPDLPFADGSFDLALCSHLLFLYSDHLSLDEHIAAVRELLRVAREVRIFPLLSLSGEPSPYIIPLCKLLSNEGYAIERQVVPYEFMRGGNTMLKSSRREAGPAC